MSHDLKIVLGHCCALFFLGIPMLNVFFLLNHCQNENVPYSSALDEDCSRPGKCRLPGANKSAIDDENKMLIIVLQRERESAQKTLHTTQGLAF